MTRKASPDWWRRGFFGIARTRRASSSCSSDPQRALALGRAWQRQSLLNGPICGHFPVGAGLLE
jgi:hypothetical protein